MFGFQFLKMLLILFIFLINPLHADGDECSLVDEWNQYFKTMTETFVDPEYQNINCLTFIMYGMPAVCDFTKFALPIDTASCRYVRENIIDYNIDQARRIMSVEARTVASQIENIDKQLVYEYDIDSDEVCVELQAFNKKPKSEKTKQIWADLYNKTGKYLTNIYVTVLHLYHFDKYIENLGDCILDIDSKARIFFGNLEAPIRTE